VLNQKKSAQQRISDKKQGVDLYNKSDNLWQG